MVRLGKPRRACPPRHSYTPTPSGSRPTDPTMHVTMGDSMAARSRRGRAVGMHCTSRISPVSFASCRPVRPTSRPLSAADANLASPRFVPHTRSPVLRRPVRRSLRDRRDAVGQEVPEEATLAAGRALVLPRAESPALAHVTGQQPAQVSLARAVGDAAVAILRRTVHHIPAGLLPELRPQTTRDQQQKQGPLQCGAGLPPPLFAALNRSRRNAEKVRQLGLADPDLSPHGLEIDGTVPQHVGRHLLLLGACH